MPGTRHPSFIVRYELQGGKVAKTTLIAAKTKQPLDATVTRSEFRMNADELTASVAFDLAEKARKYEYDFVTQ